MAALLHNAIDATPAAHPFRDGALRDHLNRAFAACPGRITGSPRVGLRPVYGMPPLPDYAHVGEFLARFREDLDERIARGLVRIDGDEMGFEVMEPGGGFHVQDEGDQVQGGATPGGPWWGRSGTLGNGLDGFGAGIGWRDVVARAAENLRKWPTDIEVNPSHYTVDSPAAGHRWLTRTPRNDDDRAGGAREEESTTTASTTTATTSSESSSMSESSTMTHTGSTGTGTDPGTPPGTDATPSTTSPSTHDPCMNPCEMGSAEAGWCDYAQGTPLSFSTEYFDTNPFVNNGNRTNTTGVTLQHIDVVTVISSFDSFIPGTEITSTYCAFRGSYTQESLGPGKVVTGSTSGIIEFQYWGYAWVYRLNSSGLDPDDPDFHNWWTGWNDVCATFGCGLCDPYPTASCTGISWGCSVSNGEGLGERTVDGTLSTSPCAE